MAEIEVGTILFRAEVFGDSVYYQTGVVTKLTPKGFWIEPPQKQFKERFRGREEDVPDAVTLLAAIDPEPHPERRWFSFNTYRWSAAKEEALRHLVARKRSYVKHTQRRLDNARHALFVATEAVAEEDGKSDDRTLVPSFRWGYGW